MSQEIYVGDTGTVLVLDCGQDISTATALSIEARKPNGDTVSWGGTLEGTSAVRFDTLADSLDAPGKWKLQSLVTTPAGVWRGKTVLLTVLAKFG
jgi:hypothetical protein